MGVRNCDSDHNCGTFQEGEEEAAGKEKADVCAGAADLAVDETVGLVLFDVQ